MSNLRVSCRHTGQDGLRRVVSKIMLEAHYDLRNPSYFVTGRVEFMMMHFVGFAPSGQTGNLVQRTDGTARGPIGPRQSVSHGTGGLVSAAAPQADQARQHPVRRKPAAFRGLFKPGEDLVGNMRGLNGTPVFTGLHTMIGAVRGYITCITTFRRNRERHDRKNLPESTRMCGSRLKQDP